jgi:hypothetical protein
LDALLKISLWHMSKFDYLLNRLKSYKDHDGSLLDNCLVLYGSGMGHSDNHTATRVPIVLAGGKGMIKTGRYVRYAKNQQLSRLHLALLQKFGVETQGFAGSSKLLPGLDASDFAPYKERPFQSWLQANDEGVIRVQGRLRMSDDLDEAKIFYVDVEGMPSVRLELVFQDFHRFNVAYHCGTAVLVEGTGVSASESGGAVIKKIQKLQSVFGNLPGDAPG